MNDQVVVGGGARQSNVLTAKRARVEGLSRATPADLTEAEQLEAVQALRRERESEVAGEWRRVVMRRQLVHPAVWTAMCEGDRNSFVRMDDAYTAAGPGKDKISLALMCSETEVMLPGHLVCSPSVQAYKLASTSVARVARDVHIVAAEHGSRIRSFVEGIEDNVHVPDAVREGVPDMLEALNNILVAANMAVAVPNVHINNL